MKTLTFAGIVTLVLAGASDHIKRQDAHSSVTASNSGSLTSMNTATRTRSSTTSRTTSNTSNIVVPTVVTTTSGPLPTFVAPVIGSKPKGLDKAPGLPDYHDIKPVDYPEMDKKPSPDSDLVREWMKEIDWEKIPNIPPTAPGGCQNATFNTEAIKNAGADNNCWWTCGYCTRPNDVTVCPAKMTWGMSFDDGPSAYTPKLLNWLSEKNLLATFFVVGSRVVSRPDILQRTYLDGHQISVHTWAHSALTTLTNEEVVAELGWSRHIIKQATGVTPVTMRPPYGDIDDRVRFISHSLGMTPIIWTTEDGKPFDTQDWRSAGGDAAQVDAVVKSFQDIVDTASTLDTGFIVLAHDTYESYVDMAIQRNLPYAMRPDSGLTLQPIDTCIGNTLSQSYLETTDKAQSAVPEFGTNSKDDTDSGKNSQKDSAKKEEDTGVRAKVGIVAVLLAGITLATI